MESLSPSPQAFWWLSNPDACVVDGVISVLKRNRRWSDDARSLRQASKRWCLEITRHVKSIHPHNRQRITDEDVQSLTKFTWLTSLDINPYVCGDQTKSISENCSTMLRILHQLPQLSQVIMDVNVLSEMRENELGGLKLKSVKLTGWDITPEDLFKLSVLPLEEIDLHAINTRYLGRFLAALPHLKRLTMRVFYRIKPEDCKALAALDELKLRYRGKHLMDLSTLSSIVFLHISTCPLDNLEPFNKLDKLKNLSVYIESSAVFGSDFWKMMQQLKCLTLESRGEYISLPPMFWEMATGLEELHLNHFHVDSNVMMQHKFNNLSTLALEGCIVHGEHIPTGLTSLTTLHMMYSRRQWNELPQGRMDPRPLKKLTELKVFFHKKADMTEELLDRISQVKSLESLELVAWRLSLSSPFPCSNFESLGKLPLLSSLKIGGSASQEAIQILKNMKFLAHLKDVDISLKVDSNVQ